VFYLSLNLYVLFVRNLANNRIDYIADGAFTGLPELLTLYVHSLEVVLDLFVFTN